MALNLLSRFISLALCFNCYVHAALVDSGVNLRFGKTNHEAFKIHDATPAEIAQILDGGHVQLSEIKVENWPETVVTTMNGQGVHIQRDSKIQAKWNLYIHGSSQEEKGQMMARALGWTGKAPAVLPPLDANCHGNPELVKFQLAQYPIKLPQGVAHYYMSFRAPLVDETKWSQNDHWLNGHSPEEMLKWVDAHDFFGTNIPKSKIIDEYSVQAKRDTDEPSFVVGSGLWPDDERLNPTYKGDIPKRDGIEAMEHISKPLTQLIQKEFPGKEFVYFRVNRALRTFHYPNIVHILVKMD